MKKDELELSDKEIGLCRFAIDCSINIAAVELDGNKEKLSIIGLNQIAERIKRRKLIQEDLGIIAKSLEDMLEKKLYRKDDRTAIEGLRNKLLLRIISPNEN